MHKQNIIRQFLSGKEAGYTLLTLVSSAVNYVTLILYGRYMDVSGYAEVSTAQSFLANYTVFIIPAGILLCRHIASQTDDVPHTATESTADLHMLVSLSLTVDAVLCMAALLLSPLLMRYLGRTAWTDFALLTGCILSFCVYYTLRGAVQGKQAFGALGIAEILLYGVKLPISLMMIKSGYGVTGCLAGILAAQTAAALFMTWRLGLSGHSIPKAASGLHVIPPRSSLPLWNSYLHILVLQAALSLFMNNGEILLANFYCDKDEIGLYVVAAHLAKILFYMISILGTLLLPKVAAGRDESGKRRFLHYTLTLSMAGAGLYSIIVYAFRLPLIRMLYGEPYLDAEHYILPALAYTVSLSLFFLYNQYLFATDRQDKPARIVLILTLIAVPVFLILQPSMYLLPWMLTGMMGVMIGGMKLATPNDDKPSRTHITSPRL